MAETFKVSAVNPETKQWASAYGPMVTYTIMVEGRELPVEINKKPESPAPAIGDELYGDINRTEYGDKFKSAPKPFGGGGSFGGAKTSGGGGYAPKPQHDPYTMFLSYVKDIAVALIGAKAYTVDRLNEIATDVASAGEMFYAMRPEANKPADKPAESTTLDTVIEPTDEVLKDIDKAFGNESKEEDAWQKPSK